MNKNVTNKSILKYGWLRAAIMIISFFAFVFLFSAFKEPILSLFEGWNDFLQILILQFIELMFILFIVSIFMHYMDKLALKELGFEYKKMVNRLLYGTAWGAMSIFIGFIILLSINEIECQ
jgi:hypothetical protein